MLDTLIIITGSLLLSLTGINLLLKEILILTLAFSVITAISLFVFSKGSDKDPGSQNLHLLSAISIKILLEMVLALLWFFNGKKSGAASLILFFVLYLAFSLFSIILMLNTLKNKSL